MTWTAPLHQEDADNEAVECPDGLEEEAAPLTDEQAAVWEHIRHVAYKERRLFEW